MFTPDQIAFIESIVDKRIAQCNSKDPAKQLAIDVTPPYHTVAMIRGLIIIHEPALRDVLSGEFHIAVLAHELAKFTTLYDRDREPAHPSRKSYTRWAAQLTDALIPSRWSPRASCPIVSTGTRGHYRFVDKV